MRSVKTRKVFIPIPLENIKDDGVVDFAKKLMTALSELQQQNYDDINALQKAEKITVLPTAAEIYRGKIILLDGGVGVADLLKLCRKNAADAYEWVNLI